MAFKLFITSYKVCFVLVKELIHILSTFIYIIFHFFRYFQVLFTFNFYFLEDLLERELY